VPSVLRRVAATACTLLVAGLVSSLAAVPAPPAVAAGAGSPGSPGSPGIGDPSFPRDGNGGYDVAHYAVSDRYAVRTGALRGSTTVSATATQDLSSFHLDLVLVPDAVSVDGRAARFAKAGRHELVVTPVASLPAGSRFTVVVRYHGTPRRTAWGGERPFFAVPGEAMATNEPHVAPWWYAVNDHPRDKATYDITVSVARGAQVLSNGTLVERRTRGARTAWHWRSTKPMASYLAFFAAGHFRVQSGTSRGLPWTVAVSRSFDRRSQDRLLRLVRGSAGITRWLSTQLGPYPFESTGGVVTAIDTGFALENQTRPTYPFLAPGHDGHSVVVHELAHQWFGDEVSVDRWRDVWLNEGFASWAEWRYDETHGRSSASVRLQQAYRAHPAGDAFWRLRIGSPPTSRLFDEPVYDRGAMALQALRHRLGTARFLTLLRTWVSEHAYGNGRVEQFEALAERVGGQDLGGFFDAWLHRRTRPARTAANGLR
jgi:aminopeptidase N